MRKPMIAIPSFPGSNGEVDNLRTLKRCGFECFLFRWNDSREKLAGVDGYFFGAGFSYEDRGRSGMVAARDPLFQFLSEEADRGKVIIGNCNGAQMLIESGLIPLSEGLRMSLARNAIRQAGSWQSPGFLGDWIWIKRSCERDRCATSDWDGVMQIPIAHGEGRFVTKDPALIAALKEHDQIAFQYCDETGNVSMDPRINPNGSMEAIAGICNTAGNVVALMPHPERTPAGDPYFHSVRRWIEERKAVGKRIAKPASAMASRPISVRSAQGEEIFIDTIIVNNEERTVESVLRREFPSIHLKQYRYIAPGKTGVARVLSTLSLFNPNKEVAYVRSKGAIERWDHDKRRLIESRTPPLLGIALLRCDEPDTLAHSLGEGSASGICYDCRSVGDEFLSSSSALDVLYNSHAATLERLA